jgi:phosphopantothenoylcysteine decarboxylase/phosphopantothenate--cysteine ligase
MKILITSGGCKVPIDCVRHIGNFSSGRYGAHLAAELNKHGREVLCFMEKGSVSPLKYMNHSFITGTRVPPEPLTCLTYKYYQDYLGVKEIISRMQPDIIISAAAISDYVLDKVQGKISSSGDEMVLRLRKGEKVLSSFRELAPAAMIVGFKLLVSPTDDERNEALMSQFQQGVDMVVYNDLTKLRAGNSSRTVYYGEAFGESDVVDTPAALATKILEYYV